MIIIQFENILLAGVMRANFAALVLVHDTLEHRSENSGADFVPVEVKAIQQSLPHFGIELSRGQKVGKQTAIYIAESF